MVQPPRVDQRQPWLFVLGLFFLTSMIEGLGVAQIFAFLPLYLREVGLAEPLIPQWVGWLTALTFLFGLPLVPLWGVWADKYSRKAVVIRSALVEVVVFAALAASNRPWQLAASMLLVGFQLGNTGVMLAALRDVTPARRLGLAIALFGAASPVGFALGPALGSFLVDGMGASLDVVFLISAALTAGVALLLWIGFREVRPAQIPQGPTLHLAFGATRSVFTEPITRRLFIIFGVSILARLMVNPYLPILTEQIHGDRPNLASAIALVVGSAALIGGLVSPLAGLAGDRLGFRPVLVGSLAVLGGVLLAMPFVPSVAELAVLNGGAAAAAAAVSAMVFGLLAVDVPAAQRSATLNLVFLPLYLAGIVGPAIGAMVVNAGLSAVFVTSGLFCAFGAMFTVFRLRRPILTASESRKEPV